MIKLIKPHYNSSIPVSKYSEIKKDAEELLKLVDQEFEGSYAEAYALSHCQVREHPFAFFVLNSKIVKEWKAFPHRVIINPKIISVPAKAEVLDDQGKVAKIRNEMFIEEACMWFPHRRPKKLRRYYQIRVQYQIPFFFGLFLRTITEDCDRLKAHILQHNIDHINGKNIYFSK